VITNLLILLLIIGLVVLFGWLTWRAVHAKRLWVKIAGGLGAGLLTLLCLVIAFYGGKGLISIYFPEAPDAPELAVAGSAEQVARGEYLVNISCFNCHSAAGPGGMPSGAPPMSGGANLTEAEGFGFVGDIITENLTPGGKLAGYSDGELFRSLRYNVTRDGRRMVMMAYMPYAQLSDEDIRAIIAYLRTQPAAEISSPTGDSLNFIGAILMGAGLFGPPAPPPPATIVVPEHGVTAEYGKYVASFGECRGCHGPDMTGADATIILPAVPNPRPFVSTLSQEQFVEMMRTGIKPYGAPFQPNMPFQNAAKMTDEDLAALYAYIIAPVK
jgi:mono/diheme cytochrome c family protein